MIFVWLAFFIIYLVCAAIIIPRETVQRYRSAPRDWQYWLAHLCFYAIPLSYFFGVDDPSGVTLLVSFVPFTVGAALSIWARVSNPWFSHVIEVPPAVVTDGAYAVFAHPGYIGMGLMATASWLMIGHSLAAIPLAFYVALLRWRAKKETSLIYQ